MRKGKDPRINAGYASIKDYLVLLIMLAVLSAVFMVSMRFFMDRGMLDTGIPFVKFITDVFIFVTAACFLAIMAYFRQKSWRRPIRTFGEAARKVAGGDFTVRIPPMRRDGKKDFIEVMFDDFNTMVEELSGIETMRNDFIANVSHEIKTPLSLIQSYAAVLQDGDLLPQERREYTQTIMEAAQKLSVLVTNILKLNKLENRIIMPEARPYDLSEQIRQCAATFADKWEGKNIGFEADLDEINVCYDESMLEIVWNNLLSNAVKFTNPGGKIYVSLKAQDGFAVISVTDTGTGIAKDIQKRIFDKFFQGDASHSGEGNGLGLALVKRTVELLGGTVQADSDPGHGATFIVCLKI
ncbi:MAG: HAMP domain-containing histidine kinase [Treponema sp.]|nr:HAMP domain-containing histidine kinase [Treponema sp.]